MYWLDQGQQKRAKLGAVILGGLLLVWCGSISAYYQKRDFLNQGYLVPFGEIASYIEARSPGRPVLLVDGYNTDPAPLLALMRDQADIIKIRGQEAERLARSRIGAASGGTVWFLRNTHDISPAKVVSELEARLAESHEGRQSFFVPYSAADHLAIKLLGWPEEPGFHYQLTEFQRRETDVSR